MGVGFSFRAADPSYPTSPRDDHRRSSQLRNRHGSRPFRWVSCVMAQEDRGDSSLLQPAGAVVVASPYSECHRRSARPLTLRQREGDNSSARFDIEKIFKRFFKWGMKTVHLAHTMTLANTQGKDIGHRDRHTDTHTPLPNLD